LPPLEPDGTSYLWDALGRKFTDMTYAEADRLSKKNKEFIKGLFPEGAIYASLLPQQAQDVIGKVGAQTKGVERMLRRVGFRYAERVDPFDGGPHFTAPTDEVSLVARTRQTRVGRLLATSEWPKTRALIATEVSEPPYFRATWSPWREVGESGGDATSCEIDKETAARIGASEGDRVWVLPCD
jgi:arginine N-succinyltransferase